MMEDIQMRHLQAMKASVVYQGVFVARDADFLHMDTEKAGLAVDDPLPVATELTLEVHHAGGVVKGSAIVTRVQESRSESEKGQMHVRWVEFSDADLERLSSWLAQNPMDALPVLPEPAVSQAAEPAAAAPDVTAPAAVAMPAAPDVTAPMETVQSGAPAEESVPDAVPQAVHDEERTLPVDSATQIDMPAITEDAPQQDGENSDPSHSPSDPGSEKGEEDGGDKKKRRRRRK